MVTFHSTANQLGCQVLDALKTLEVLEIKREASSPAYKRLHEDGPVSLRMF